jgi:Cu(I)/Ag(I) efflux system protein CusF
MKLQTALFVAALFAASLQQPSNAGNTSPASAQSMQSQTTAVGTRASATGRVMIVDATAGRITISHGPVAALKWPAMTMAFKATPAQMAAVHVGQKVDFEFVSKGMDGTLTRIGPTK